MKRLLLVFFLFSISLYASNLLTYNIYERSDRVDIMLSFDAPYEGKIYQKKEDGAIILTLEDLYFDQSIQRTLQSPIVQALSLDSFKNVTVATLQSEKDFNIIASKTADGFGLRIRARLAQVATKQSSTKSLLPATSPSNQSTQKPKVESPLLDGRYLSVVGVLVLLLLVLLWIKRRIGKTGNTPSLSWIGAPQNNKSIRVLFQKPIDAQNRVVLLEFGATQYLILSGNSNVLLDRFGDAKIKDDKDFKSLFEQNRQKLDEYLQVQQTQLNAYKEKASQDFTPYS